MASSTLALRGGPKAVTRDPGDLFTPQDEEAVLDVLHRRPMSNSDVTEAASGRVVWIPWFKRR